MSAVQFFHALTLGLGLVYGGANDSPRTFGDHACFDGSCKTERMASNAMLQKNMKKDMFTNEAIQEDNKTASKTLSPGKKKKDRRHQKPHNQRNGLLPLKGAWRGTTIVDDELFDHLPYHIKRGFKRAEPEFDEWELDFIRRGGIYFYALQPHDWVKACDGSEDSRIQRYVAAIKGVAPAKVMVAPGFEPDGHISDIKTNTDTFGTAAEYVKMYNYYVDFFARNHVTNVVWVMDYSANIRDKNKAYVDKLWPGDAVQWLFFNLFQKHSLGDDGGDCLSMLDQLYSIFSKSGKYDHIPWGLGAWGSMSVGFKGNNIPTADREKCLNDMTSVFDANRPSQSRFSNVKASIYFNSLTSQLSTTTDKPSLIAAFKGLQHAHQFSVND